MNSYYIRNREQIIKKQIEYYYKTRILKGKRKGLDKETRALKINTKRRIINLLKTKRTLKIYDYSKHHYYRYLKDNNILGSQQRSIDFFMKLANAPIKHIAIENLVCIMSSKWRKPNQIIQPWQFGDAFQKTTCLWLKNLPNLIPTNIVNKGEFVTFKSGKRMSKWMATSFGNGKERSKTFPGIAKAIAEQWGLYIKMLEKSNNDNKAKN